MVLDNKQVQKTVKRKKQSLFFIIALVCLLLTTLILKKSVPQKIGQVFEQLETKKANQLNINDQLLEKNSTLSNTDHFFLKSLCSTNFKRPDKKVLLKNIFPDGNFETQLVSENIFYKKEGFPNRIVRKTQSKLILFQEDNEGFPSPIAVNEENHNTQVLQFINGYSKKSVQRLIEYSNSSTSLVLNIEDEELIEIKLNSDEVFLECEDNKCRCD